jgi:hypothetical protein
VAILKNAFLWSWFDHNLKNAWSKLQNGKYNFHLGPTNDNNPEVSPMHV